jgi:hypothetical protein
MELDAEVALDLAQEQSTGRVRDRRERVMKIDCSVGFFGSDEGVDATSKMRDQWAALIVDISIL